MNDVDTLMSRIETINRKEAIEISATDIDDIIAYQRRLRGRKASGEKVAAPKSSVSKEEIAQLMGLLKPKPVVLFTRRPM